MTNSSAEYYSANRPVIITGMMDDWPALRKWNLDYFADPRRPRGQPARPRRVQSLREIQEKFTPQDVVRRFLEQRAFTSDVSNDFYMTANNDPLTDDTGGIVGRHLQIPEYLDGRDPARLLLVRPRRDLTPFTMTLTNNFMAQVLGRKLVRLAPSWDMRLKRNDSRLFDLDGCAIPPRPPRPDSPQILECCIGPGEILFLPVGCLHRSRGSTSR